MIEYARPRVNRTFRVAAIAMLTLGVVVSSGTAHASCIFTIRDLLEKNGVLCPRWGLSVDPLSPRIVQFQIGGTTDSGLIGATASAFTAWNNYTNGAVYFAQEGAETISWDPAFAGGIDASGATTLAVTTRSYDVAGNISGYNIKLNSKDVSFFDYAPSSGNNKISLRRVLIHEAGHVLGLHHLERPYPTFEIEYSDCPTVMKPVFSRDEDAAWVGDWDQIAAKARYICPGGVTWGCVKSQYWDHRLDEHLTAFSGVSNTLIWDMPEADLAVQSHVFRWVDGDNPDDAAEIGRVSPQTTTFVDEQAVAGVHYRYRVGMEDGNEIADLGTSEAGLKLLSETLLDNDQDTSPQAMVARGNIVFIALSNTLIRFDVSDPGHPIETGRRILTPDATGDQYHRLAFSSNGSLLYVTTRRHFFILNALGGVGIPLVGQLNNLATNAAGGGSDDSVVWDMVVDGDIVYVSRAVDGLVAIDIYSPSAPRIAGSYAGPYGFNEPDGVMSMELMGNDLFITRDNRLERLSVNKTIGPWPLTNHPHGTVSFSLSCSSADNTCWPAGLSGIGLGSNLGEGKGAITQTSWGATGEAAVLSRLDPATSPVRTFDPAGYGIGNFDVDSRFTYSIGWQDTHHYEYDRSVIAEEIWNVEDPSVFVTGDLSGGVNSAGNLSSYGRYLYVADGFMPAGALDFSPRLRIFEKSTGCKPDPIAPVKLIPNRDAYKVGEQIGLAWAVGCPISATVDLLESDTPSLLKSDNYVMADDVAYGMTWTVAGPSSNYEDHVYKIRVSATYEDNSTQVFTSTPFRIEVGAKREVSLGGNKPFTSVQAAINASASGDTVVVYAGTYNEHVTLKSNVRIIGKPGASISPSTTGAAMTANGLVNTPTIDGIEFHSSGASTGAISVTGCGINVKNCTFNSLTRAVSISAGHGQFTSCTFANNQDQAGFGGAVWLDADGVQQTSFTDCRFINNSAAVRGGAVYLGSAGTYLSSMPQPNFIRCVFSGNSAPEAAAVRVGINRRPLFDHCVFASNQPGAVSGGSVVGGTAGVAGGVSATFTNCTFASNSGTQSYDVVRLEPGGTVPLPTIDATIFANNVYGNALGTSFGGTYAVSHSDFYGNSTGDATWAANGTGNFSENPAFCPAGDYSIYAFSPCAAGVKSAAVVGAREIACVPHATVTVSPGSANPNYLLVCPKGDQDMLAVQVVLDPTVMTRAPKAGELAIHAPYAPADIYSDKTITSVIDAAAPGYLMRIEHKYLSGYTWLHLPIYLNGYPLAQEALVKRRSPDLIGGDGGTNQLPIPDGKVALADFSRWTQGFPYSGHPAAYDSLCDLDANSVVNNSDFTRFVFHYKNPEHAQPFSLPALQMTFPGPVATSSAHVGMEFTEEYVTSVERHLNVDMSLEDAAGATACIFAVRTNRSDLRFLDWEKANPNILFANVTVDSVQQLYVGVAYPGPYTKATERLGQMTFDIEGSAPVDIGENEFVLTVGDIEIMGGDNQTYGAQLSGVFGRTIKGPVQQVFHNRLEQNFPNPFNPQTTIAFSIKKASNVRLAIYDVTGSRVKDLVDEKRVPGAYRVIWDGRNQSGNQVASGVYFYKLTAGDFTSAKKMVVLK